MPLLANKRRPRYFQGPMTQRGAGLGSFLGGLFRRVLPYVSKAWGGLKSIVTSPASKELGRELVRTGLQTTADIISSDKSQKEVIDEGLTRARHDVSQALRRQAMAAEPNDTLPDSDSASDKRKKKKKRYERKRQRSPSPVLSSPRRQRVLGSSNKKKSKNKAPQKISGRGKIRLRPKWEPLEGETTDGSDDEQHYSIVSE